MKITLDKPLNRSKLRGAILGRTEKPLLLVLGTSKLEYNCMPIVYIERKK